MSSPTFRPTPAGGGEGTHNDLAGLQGGTTDQYYHLTAAQYAVLAGSGITWNEVTETSQAASVDNGYITNNSSLVTVTLPSTIAVGKIIRVSGKGSGKWKIAQNASQIIYFGDQNTTSGTAGYLAAQNQYDGIELLCITTNTTFNVISSVGNITVV